VRGRVLAPSLDLSLRAGAEREAKVVLKASGVHLGLDPLPATQPIRVQLESSEGECWEATCLAPAKVNDERRFKDRAGE